MGLFAQCWRMPCSKSHTVGISKTSNPSPPNFPMGSVRALGPSIRVSHDCRTIMVKQWSKAPGPAISPSIAPTPRSRQTVTVQPSSSSSPSAAKQTRSQHAGTGSRHPAQYRVRIHMMNPAAAKIPRGDGLHHLPRWLRSNQWPPSHS